MASSVVATVVMAVGMLVTYACLFALVSILSLALFPSALVERWAGGASGGIGDQLRAASFLSTLGLLIGALGATFEQRSYLNHVTYADDEIWRSPRLGATRTPHPWPRGCERSPHVAANSWPATCTPTG